MAHGESALRLEQEEAVEETPLESRVYLSTDGTGIPMQKEDVEGVSGKQDEWSSRTREAKPAVMYIAERRDPETGTALKGSGSENCGCLINSAVVPSGSKGHQEFVARTSRSLRCMWRIVVLTLA